MQCVRFSELDYNEDDALYYHGRSPFTGVAYTATPDGRKQTELEYRDGVGWGTGRRWFPSGNLASEYHCAGGVWNGLRREWRDDGRLVVEEVFELGVCLSRRRWDDHGTIVEDYRLRPDDEEYQDLLFAREMAAPVNPLESGAEDDALSDDNEGRRTR